VGLAASQPALEGLHVVASLMEPATNLRQDARQVAAIYRHFATHTAPLVAALPSFQPGRAEAGRLYRRGRFLLAHQGSLHVAALDGPRGRLAASAYNYILRRFASFFAVRRATLRALATLPAEVQRRAATSADPCLRQQSRGWPVRAEPVLDSTRGPALPYPAGMRSSTILIPLLFILANDVRCKDDEPAGSEFGEPCGGEADPCAGRPEVLHRLLRREVHG
jgi:hypothetical protein